MNLETLLPRNLSVLQYNEWAEHCTVNSEPLIQITINSSLKFNVEEKLCIQIVQTTDYTEVIIQLHIQWLSKITVCIFMEAVSH